MKKLLISVLFIIFVSAVAYSQQHIVIFKIYNKSEIKHLPSYVSIDSYKKGEVRAYIADKYFLNFKNLGIKYKEIAEKKDLKGIKMAKTILEMKNWDRYPTYGVYVKMMQDYATKFSNICKLDTIGESQNGRLLLVMRITDNPDSTEAEPQFFYTSTMHGDETTGYVLMLHLIDSLLEAYNTSDRIKNLVDNYDIYINPLANPDGTYKSSDTTVSGAQRFLANGDDPNRDFPYPLDKNHITTNPETQAMMKFASEHNFVMSINFHGGSEVYNYPWDCWYSSDNPPADNDWFEHIGVDYVDTARKVLSSYMTTVTQTGVTEGADWYPAYGTRQDYMNYFHHCKEVTMELSNTKLLSSDELPYYWKINKLSLLNYIENCKKGFWGVVKNAKGEALRAKIFIINHDKDSSCVYTDASTGAYYRPIAPGKYTVVYSAYGYASDTVNIDIDNWNSSVVKNIVLYVATTVKNKPIVRTKLYPNPVKNYFFVEVSDTNSYLYIFDVKGKTLLFKKLDLGKNEINISDFSKNLYFVKIVSKDSTFIKKILKE
jgi:hypothetical protein